MQDFIYICIYKNKTKVSYYYENKVFIRDNASVPFDN